MHFLSFYTIKKTLTLRMNHAKLFDVLTSLPISHVILPRGVCFATSRPANHAICCFIDLRGYASGQIRRCLFIDYIINIFIFFHFHEYIHAFFFAFQLFNVPELSIMVNCQMAAY